MTKEGQERRGETETKQNPRKEDPFDVVAVEDSPESAPSSVSTFPHRIGSSWYFSAFGPVLTYILIALLFFAIGFLLARTLFLPLFIWIDDDVNFPTVNEQISSLYREKVWKQYPSQTSPLLEQPNQAETPSLSVETSGESTQQGPSVTPEEASETASGNIITKATPRFLVYISEDELRRLRE
mmetsp:Transcript_30575/g.79748  ORF Transcript_30575/g.79748 Transcript_30575/m.79748 type:complete len:183 (-) Transcript_30575:7539-8087(-)|eukprot:CAMPEP_0113878602 /NCGR_PEP_ID=MMETSP0780_2-20120614/6781_1 /TAXON_ID=652834 /ORGANISM="Palpitomonas bilix" /LENGTH=182 /DNA_ID=CAMNT_0000865105 /DNA_START=290 /DNA_END=838 /DNA_ORIENTATION=+ /assembly_acc=CAM_ASM_000599